jgi:hypothetical protein
MYFKRISTTCEAEFLKRTGWIAMKNAEEDFKLRQAITNIFSIN